jgi:hypothetical protein
MTGVRNVELMFTVQANLKGNVNLRLGGGEIQDNQGEKSQQVQH